MEKRAVRFLIGGAALLILVFLMLTGIQSSWETQRQLDFLAAHHEEGQYLIPADCGAVPRGTLNQDYIRGSADRRSERRHSKDICWYTPSTYDRLFADAFPEKGLAAHKAQAINTDVDLLSPAFGALVGIRLGFAAVFTVAAAILLWRRRL